MNRLDPRTNDEYTFKFRLPQSMWRAMRRAARKDEETMAGWLRGAIQDKIDLVDTHTKLAREYNKIRRQLRKDWRHIDLRKRKRRS